MRSERGKKGEEPAAPSRKRRLLGTDLSHIDDEFASLHFISMDRKVILTIKVMQQVVAALLGARIKLEAKPCFPGAAV